ncbi:MAG: MerR family transcriptional regulator [Chlorobi bacterium]|nr:MerR family transcriptional regulator [Chlorobiota bacterium]
MKQFTVGKLSSEAEINVETVRYYESIGLMPKPKRTESGYRVYSEADLGRLKFVKKSQRLGFTLKEIKELLFMRIDEETTCRDLKEMAEQKIKEVDSKIRELKKIKKALEILASQCHSSGPKSECPILENLEK